MRIIQILFFVLLGGNLFGQLPPNFREVPIPESNSKELSELNYSPYEFKVEVLQNKLIVSESKPHWFSILVVGGDSLIGTNNGEWGGSLVWRPRGKNQERVEIKKGNIVDIFSFENRTIFLEGVAHGAINEGKVFELKKSDDKFQYKELIDLGDAPECFAITGDSIIIATFTNLFLIKNFKIQNERTQAFWHGLYPNSMVVLDHTLYIGMRGGVAAVSLRSLEVKFFKFFV